METLNKLLDQIEIAIDQDFDLEKDKIYHELHKLYTFHALDICVGKLTNNSTKIGKDGIIKTKNYLDKIKHMDLE